MQIWLEFVVLNGDDSHMCLLGSESGSNLSIFTNKRLHIDSDGHLHMARVWLSDSLHHMFCLSLCDMCHANAHEGWILLVRVRQLIAKQRVGNIIAFLPHSHTNTLCRHSWLLIGIPPCACELSTKVLHLAGQWPPLLLLFLDSRQFVRHWLLLLTMKSNDSCVFESDYYLIRCPVHYLNSQQSMCALPSCWFP